MVHFKNFYLFFVLLQQRTDFLNYLYEFFWRKKKKLHEKMVIKEFVPVFFSVPLTLEAHSYPGNMSPNRVSNLK